jgi:hypothetical protein
MANPGGYAYISPEVTLNVSGANFTTIRAIGQFFKTNNGIWRIKGNISGVAVGAPATLTLAIAGISFKNTTSNYVGISVTDATNKNQYMLGYPDPNTANIIMYCDAMGWKDCGCSFDLELDAKPTAYLPEGV